MKKIFIILISIIILSACAKPHQQADTRNGYTYDLDTIRGHAIIYDDREYGLHNHGLMHDPSCNQCRVEMKQLMTEVLDSIIDEKIITLLGK